MRSNVIPMVLSILRPVVFPIAFVLSTVTVDAHGADAVPAAARPAQVQISNGCPSRGRDAKALAELKSSGFEIEDAGRRRQWALSLVDCLASPDPQIRDALAYEALNHWMRAGAFDAETLRVLRDRLARMLEAPDPQGFAHPFAALALAEVARTDRIAPWMEKRERAAMVEAAAIYLESVRDYRGYDPRQGWRHGVAHGADWALQLTMNPNLERAGLERLLRAVAAQAVPASGHAYVFGEPERLARPVLYAAKRGLLDEAYWSAWFAALPARLGDPALAWKDPVWLGRRHDLQAFLLMLYMQSDLSEDPGIVGLRPGLRAAIEAVP